MRFSLRLSVYFKVIALITACSIVPMIAVVGLQMLAYHHLNWSVICGVMSFSLLTLVAGYAFARHLTRPIGALLRGVQHAAKTDFAPIPLPGSHDELEELSIAF